MNHFPLITRTTKAVDWLFSAEQQRRDDAIDAAHEARLRAEAAVTFDDVLEEMSTASTPVQKALFMESLNRGERMDRDMLYALLDQMKQAIVNRALKA